MIAGPLLNREMLTVPRALRHHLLRIGFLTACCVLLWTAHHITFGLKQTLTIGDMSRFGAFIFNVLCGIQLVLVIGSSLMLSAGSVAQEKDRRTLIILLMTDLRSTELVVGKALGSLLSTVTLIVLFFPALCALSLLGGITVPQIVWVELLCLASALAAAAWGTFVAYWRDKTFQTLAITVLGAGLFVGVVEILVAALGDSGLVAEIIGGLNPFRTLGAILSPLTAQPDVATPVAFAGISVAALFGMAVVLFTWASLRVRIWNPSRVVHFQQEETKEEAGRSAAPTRAPRPVWARPLLWRETCTEAYGKKVGLIKGAYFVVLGLCLLWVASSSADSELLLGSLSPAGVAFVGLSLTALLLVNAQAVTSLTSERDGQTLELLLVTEVSAKEFIFSKLGGILFNMKEVIAVPLLFALSMLLRNSLPIDAFFYVVIGFLALVCFGAMLGLHASLSYENSRSAILNSLGTMFFLFVGIFVCIVLIVEARSSYQMQFVPFLTFIVGGSIALWVSLTRRNPSTALQISAATLPFFTFYAISSFLLGHSIPVLLSILATYGFTTTAMLMPAISSFDVAFGRSSVSRG
ncbi:MAG: ABC transporter permease subunit [Planctomycetaceae bacterium]|nr:ABC transporter permease subunit [Planctomycetaceae bacterium]